MISFGLEEEQELVQKEVRRFAAERLRPKMRELEQAGEVPAALRAEFAELGLGTTDLAEADGGQGAPAVTAAIVHEELAFGDAGAAVALAAPYGAAQALVALGDEPQRRRWLPSLATGEARAAIAYCERGAPVEGLGTRARAEGGGWVLDGKKAWVVGGATADVVIVFAQVDGEPAGAAGVGAFAVPRATAGLTVGARHETLGLATVAAHELALAGVKVPGEARLRGGGDLVAATNRLFGRLALYNAARQVGLARAAYEYALAYTQERKAFGKVIAHFQAIAFTLAEMHMDVEAARWMVWRAATGLEKNELALVWEAAAHANEAAWRVADHGVQLLGGAGYVRDYPVEKWLRDTKTLALFAPPSEALQLETAASELGHPIGASLPSSAIQPFYL